MENLTEDQREAIRLLGSMTRGRFDIWNLAGSHNAGNRAIILSKLVGRRMPQSKAGVNALRDEFYRLLAIEGSCLAAKEDHFIEVCRKTIGSVPAVTVKKTDSQRLAEAIYGEDSQQAKDAARFAEENE